MRWYWIVLLVFVVATALLASQRGHDLEAGQVIGPGRPQQVTETRVAGQLRAAGDAGVRDATKQILFGDLHVHTTFSIDAFLYALPIFASEGAHPPADACDYARYCSALDFFSINDHAEGLTPERWRATIDTLRECDARAGSADDPDLVPLLGWEWTQVGTTPDNHYGHKNVVLRGLADDEITTRPIAYRPESDFARAPQNWQLRSAESLASLAGPDYADFFWWLRRLLDMPPCQTGVDPHDLSPDCLESATTPAQLFSKLDQWGVDSIVIPHGLAWGIHAPPGARLDNQLSQEQHDPNRQTLLEVFSGHGNSEEYRPWLDRPLAGQADEVCPAPTKDFLPCCWQAGEIMRERCGDLAEPVCDARVEEAKQLALAAGVAPHFVFPQTRAEDWLDCDECRDCFKPAAGQRGGETAQYSLAISSFDQPGEEPLRFRWGFIGSSDNHRARAATGFKQLARTRTTDARGLRSPAVDSWIRRLGGQASADPNEPQRVEYNTRSFTALFDKERQASFLYPGGLVAVHATGRSRDALWQGLQRREVYGTSGPRILLWFDLLNAEEGRLNMGGSTRLDTTPRFEVRAVGAFEQRPGCPDHAVAGLGFEGVERLCLGECYHPGSRRHLIEAIEVVRVRPQMAAGEPIGNRIEDPWRRFDCPRSREGCVIQFEDDEFVSDGGDAVYYARALQEATPAVNGANVRTRFDEDGNATSVQPCYGNYMTPDDDDCLAAVQERAWSSPIFVDRLR
jgi:hypothetical protein